MAEKTVIATRNVFQVADDLEGLHDYFRIIRELLTDQLCVYSPEDEESMSASLERIHFLVNLIPEKLTHMQAMSAELFALAEAQKVDGIAAGHEQIHII